MTMLQICSCILHSLLCRLIYARLSGSKCRRRLDSRLRSGLARRFPGALPSDPGPVLVGPIPADGYDPMPAISGPGLAVLL